MEQKEVVKTMVKLHIKQQHISGPNCVIWFIDKVQVLSLETLSMQPAPLQSHPFLTSLFESLCPNLTGIFFKCAPLSNLCTFALPGMASLVQFISTYSSSTHPLNLSFLTCQNREKM